MVPRGMSHILQPYEPCEPQGLAYKQISQQFICCRLQILSILSYIPRIPSISHILVLQQIYQRETHLYEMVIVLIVALAFARISFASPLSLPLLNSISPNNTDIADSPLLSWSSEFIDTGTLRLNISSTHVSNLSAFGSPKLLCQGPLSGRAQTTLAPCQEALRSVPNLPTSHSEVTFGPRGSLIYDVGLPREYMSTDLSCMILLGIKPPSQDARATPYDVGKAATMIIDYCFAGGKPAVSGFIQNFGGDNNLLVGLSALPENVRVNCEGNVEGPGIIESCNTLANKMPASLERELFVLGDAPSSVPNVELPYGIKDRNRCAMEVTIRGGHRPTEFSTWSTIYHAVQAINAKCIRHGRAGAWNNLGMTPNPYDQGLLHVRVYDLETEIDSSPNLTTSQRPGRSFRRVKLAA